MVPNTSAISMGSATSATQALAQVPTGQSRSNPIPQKIVEAASDVNKAIINNTTTNQSLDNRKPATSPVNFELGKTQAKERITAKELV